MIKERRPHLEGGGMPDQRRTPLHVVHEDDLPPEEKEKPLSLAEAEAIWTRNRQRPVIPPSPDAIRKMLQGRELPVRRTGVLPVHGQEPKPRIERKPDERAAGSRRRR